jgi:hypothetical protein
MAVGINSSSFQYQPQTGATSAAAPQPAGGGATGATAAAGLTAFAGLAATYGAAQASKAQGFLQQASYLTQATESLRIAGLRADKSIEYANLQADRRKMQTEFDVLNYKIQGNTLLRSLAKTNATARARAAANGVDYGGGSAFGVQATNVQNVYRDVGITDLNALTARVFGMEDATNILKAGYDQAFIDREAALGQLGYATTAGDFAARTGGILANAKLVEGGVQFAKTFPTANIGQTIKNIIA